MISASCDQSNAFGNPHALDPAFVGKIQFDPERGGRNKRNTSFHRFLGHAALPGKDRMIGNKGNQVSFGKFPTDIFLVFCQKNGFFHSFGRKIFVIQTFLYTKRKKFKKNFFQLRRVDGSSVGRKSYSKPQNDIFLCDLAGCPLQNFLSAAGDGKQTAFSGAFRPKTICRYLFLKSSGKKILKGNPGYRGGKAEGRKGRFFSGYINTDMGGGGKRISLYMIHG